jgi:hypothetical protein
MGVGRLSEAGGITLLRFLGDEGLDIRTGEMDFDRGDSCVGGIDGGGMLDWVGMSSVGVKSDGSLHLTSHESLD